MDIFGAIAIGAPCCCLAVTRLPRRPHARSGFVAFHRCRFQLVQTPCESFALFNNNFQQALGASSELFKFMDMRTKS